MCRSDDSILHCDEDVYRFTTSSFQGMFRSASFPIFKMKNVFHPRNLALVALSPWPLQKLGVCYIRVRHKNDWLSPVLAPQYFPHHEFLIFPARKNSSNKGSRQLCDRINEEQLRHTPDGNRLSRELTWFATIGYIQAMSPFPGLVSTTGKRVGERLIKEEIFMENATKHLQVSRKKKVWLLKRN